MSICKFCKEPNNNGTNFCSKKCRLSEIKKHQTKGAKKKYQNKEYYVFSSAFDSNGNSIYE
jgi:radical SAM superfamily enzyme